MTGETDENLMQLYQEGHSPAFQTLFDRHRQKVWAFLLKRLSNRENAEEVFQLTWVKFHENRFKYESQYPLLPWIFLIARQSMIDWIRKHRKHRQDVSADEFLNEIAMPAENETSDIAELWSQMNEDERKLYQAHFEDDLTFDEIAQKFSVPSATLRKRFSRMVQRLRKGGSTL